MSKQNNIRRTRRKLELMEQDGCNHLIMDALRLFDNEPSLAVGGDVEEADDNFYLVYAEMLKKGYKQFLVDNEDDNNLLKQGELDL